MTAAPRSVPIVDAAYIARLGWVHPLLSAIAAKPKFSGQLRRWPRTRLPDLAFAIDTRVTYLPQITEAANEHLEALGHDIAADWDRFTVCVADGGAFPFTNRKALNGALIAASSFIAERATGSNAIPCSSRCARTRWATIAHS